MKSKQKNNILKYFLIFVFGGFFGWLFELIFQETDMVNALSYITGFNIPFLPIYGFGFILLFVLSKYYDKIKLPIIFRVLFASTIITIYELISGVLSNLVFGYKLWDYSEHWLNFHGYISPYMFLVWIFFLTIFEFGRMLKNKYT